MRLTMFTDYSLRVLMYVASAPERKATIAQVARAFAISEHHLVKVVHLLGKGGWLKNTRGRGGGLQLAMPASEVNIGRVVRFTEGADMPAECFDAKRNTCRITGACRLEHLLREAVEAFYRTLQRYSLAHLTAGQPALVALLHSRSGVDRRVLH